MFADLFHLYTIGLAMLEREGGEYSYERARQKIP